MSVRPSRFDHVALLLIAGLAAATISLVAQAPAGSPPEPQAPAVQGAAQQEPGRGAPGQAPAPGQGGFAGSRPEHGEPDFSPKPAVLPLRPEEQVKKFWLPPGFKMELVLADPDIEESAQIAFDGNGRLWVLELRGYMQDADGGGTLEPNGRVSVHEDRNNDGVYETHKVFVDNLVFPRFVLPFGPNAILTKESNADEVWKYTDTNNDGVARQEGAVHHRHGAPGERRAPGKPLHVGHGQLDLQHLQRVPRSLDARRRRCASRPAPTARSGA